MKFVTILILVFFFAVLPLLSQEIDPILISKKTASIEDTINNRQNASSYENPNTIPYKTKRSIAEHILATPSKLWRLFWLPVGETVIWIEQNHVHQKLISFFFNKDFTGAVFPILNVGGNMGFAGGLMAFHNNLFNKGKSINLNFLISSLDDNYTTLSYVDESFLSSPVKLNLLAEFISDSDENYYLGGNDGAEDDETSYDYEKGQFQVGVSYDLIRQINWQITTNIKHVDIAQGGGKGGDVFPTDISGFGTVKLWGIGTNFTFDLRNGWPRTLSGTLIRIGYQYNQQLSEDRFEFFHYSAEVQQFLSLPFLAKNRRLSVRTRLEKSQEISNKKIPFYELSMLGTSADLRGYDQNRFRAKGSFLFNIEYRYPIWDTWDAVLFLDEGQVFNEFSEIGFDHLHLGAGAGLRFMTRTGFLFRLEAGFSKEQVRILFEMKPNF